MMRAAKMLASISLVAIGGCSHVAVVKTKPSFELIEQKRANRPIECDQELARIAPPQGDLDALQALNAEELIRSKGNAAVELHNRCLSYDKKERGGE